MTHTSSTDGFSSLSDEFYRTYAKHLKAQLPGCREIAFLNPNGTVRWSDADASVLDERLLDRLRACLGATGAQAQLIDPARLLAIFPLAEDEQTLGAVLAPIDLHEGESTDDAIERIRSRLQPLLDRMSRDLTETRRPRSKADELTDRTKELQWLYGVTAQLHTSSGETAAIQSLLAASVERMNASFGALVIPQRKLNLGYASRILTDDSAARAHQHSVRNLLTHMRRWTAPLLLNQPTLGAPSVPLRKTLALPLVELNGKLAGVLVFYKPLSLPDFGRRQLYLGRHLARQMEALLNTRHDLATGLLTRIAVEQDALHIINTRPDEPHCIAYIDVDQLHIVNETLGFDFGDEAILRIANLLQAPTLPDDVIAGRLAGDRFVVFLPACGTLRAMQYVQRLEVAANALTVGPPSRRITLSVTCGIAKLRNGPSAFSKALAAAELACRNAKALRRDRACAQPRSAAPPSARA